MHYHLHAEILDRCPRHGSLYDRVLGGNHLIIKYVIVIEFEIESIVIETIRRRMNRISFSLILDVPLQVYTKQLLNVKQALSRGIMLIISYGA